MAEDLERVRAWRRGHRGVATKYTQEAKQILETESIDNSQRERLASLQVLLQDKLKVLLKLDEDILNMFATKEIEREIKELDTVNSRITETIEQCKWNKQALTVTKTTPVRRESTPTHSEEHSAPNDPETLKEDSEFSHIILLIAQNRYCATLPWYSLHLHSTNYELCLTRLHYLRNCLQKNGSL